MTALASNDAGSTLAGTFQVKPVPSLYSGCSRSKDWASAPVTTWQSAVLPPTVAAPAPTPWAIVAANVVLPLSAGATNSAMTRSGVGDSPGAAMVKEPVSPAWAMVSGAWV